VKNIKVVSISLLVAMFVASTAQMQGMTVPAIDTSNPVLLVSGFLPYYLGADNKIHALVGEYTDAAGNTLVSAPVELFGNANASGNVDSVIKQSFPNSLKINPFTLDLRAQYTINGKTKSYYLWTIEVDAAAVPGLMQSLIKATGPASIKDVTINDFIPGALLGATIVAKKPLGNSVVEFVRSGILSAAPEMSVARGFADLLVKITKDKTNAAKYLPITAAPIAPAPAPVQISQDVNAKLSDLGTALDNLKTEIYVNIYQAQNP
jgi:hypothetical protein